jgi:hypothetical protein
MWLFDRYERAGGHRHSDARYRLHRGCDDRDVAPGRRATHDRRAGYEVGTGNGQIAPGKYFAAAPTSGPPCYYARLRNNDGEAADIVAEEMSHNQIIMTVRASDGYVKVSDCTFIAAS